MGWTVDTVNATHFVVVVREKSGAVPTIVISEGLDASRVENKPNAIVGTIDVARRRHRDKNSLFLVLEAATETPHIREFRFR